MRIMRMMRILIWMCMRTRIVQVMLWRRKRMKCVNYQHPSPRGAPRQPSSATAPETGLPHRVLAVSLLHLDQYLGRPEDQDGGRRVHRRLAIRVSCRSFRWSEQKVGLVAPTTWIIVVLVQHVFVYLCICVFVYLCTRSKSWSRGGSRSLRRRGDGATTGRAARSAGRAPTRGGPTVQCSAL